MPIYQSRNSFQSYLKKCSLTFALLFWLTAFTAPSVFAACEYLSSGDFSSGSGWTVEADTASWTIYEGMLDVKNITGASSYALYTFAPASLFNIDADIYIVSAPGQYDRIGVYVYSNKYVPFTVTVDTGIYDTDGVVGYYYPATNSLKFKFYDFDAGVWIISESYPVSGSVNSIGLSVVADGVVFRINGQNTNYKISGDFTYAANSIDTVELRAGGSSMHCRFDNVCAAAIGSSPISPGNTMPLPGGREVLTTTPVAIPVISTDPAQANPVGFGSVANSGNTLSLTASLSPLAAPADLYLGLSVGSEIFLFAPDNSLRPLSDGLIKWRSQTQGGFNARILPDVDMTAYPGTYTSYLLMTPADRWDGSRFWVSSLVVGGGSPVVPGGGAAGTVLGTLVSSLGNLDTNDFSNVVRILISSIQEGTLDTAVAAITANSPQAASMITKVGSGYKVDWGTGHTFPNGTTVAGSMTVSLGSHSSYANGSRTRIGGSYEISLKGVQINGTAVPDDNQMVSLQADSLGGGDIVGNLTMSGTVGNRGGVVFDTRKCAQKPLAGYLKMGDEIVNIAPDCSGNFVANGRDIPTLTSVSPATITQSPSWSNPSTITLHGANMWPPYDADTDGDDYIFRCHIREVGHSRMDSYVTNWTPDSITIAFPPGSPTKGTHQIVIEDCPWANISHTPDVVSFTVE